MVRADPIALACTLAPVVLLIGSCISASQATPALAEPAASRPAVVAASPASAPVAHAPELTIDTTRASQGALLRGRVSPASAAVTLNGAPVTVADDGAFIIAFDRDAPTQAVLKAESAAGVTERPIEVTGFNWSIEHVNAAMTGGAATTEEFRARRSGELAQIAAARATPVASDGWRQAFILPVQGRVSGRFGRQRIYRGEPGSYHSGMDIAAPAGTPFVAPADGVVTLAAASPFTLEGYLLIVDHGMGLTSAFLHNSRLDVRVGDVVRQGQQLGLVGATGRATGPHMHWGLRWKDTRIDPERIVGAQ
jgi:murein DD-endopeptidase MepM/ murein hydrolase activator NlpD